VNGGGAPVSAAGRIRVGIGGWVFPPWRGTFYPKGLPQAEELAFASRRVTAIEINGTFYGLQKPASFRRWHDETPEDFVFSLKGPRFITHRRDLATIGPAIDRFLESGLTELRNKLGPILWQFGPTIPLEPASFAAFVELLPEAIDGRRLRHVVELRRPGLLDATVIALLGNRRIAVARVDDDKYPALDETTADFTYARLRRCAVGEASGYPPAALDDWAETFRGFSTEGARDCFVYFIDGSKVRAPAAAQALLQRLAPSG
jgi:uncharacterized protein YecE (DUF72 family)